MRNQLNGLGVLLTAATLVVAAGACSSSHGSRSGPRLTPADFSAEAGAPHAATPSIPDQPQAAQAVRPTPEPVNVSGPVAASEGVLNLAATPGAPEVPKGPKPDPVGNSVLIDAKIGDVNGRPIYASKFLEPLADHLRANAANFERKKLVSRESKHGGPGSPDVRGYPLMPWREAWRIEAMESIDAGLSSFIEDELLRAEAVSTFTPEQKMGFLAFMRSVSEKVQSENMGSRSAANLQKQNEGGLDQYIKSREEKELIGYQLYLKINRRINITWREIKLQYEKLVAPAGAATAVTIRRIEIKADNSDAAKQLQDSIEAGSMSFAELASSPKNLNNPDGGGLERLDIKGDPATFIYYGNGGEKDQYKPLNDAARSLKPGETVGPIKVGNYLSWLHRDNDRALPPLYTAQLALENDLRGYRFAVEKAKYIERLKAKSTMTSVQEMSARLLEIAEDRYLPKKAN